MPVLTGMPLRSRWRARRLPDDIRTAELLDAAAVQSRPLAKIRLLFFLFIRPNSSLCYTDSVTESSHKF
jgi:hypothetical protein